MPFARALAATPVPIAEGVGCDPAFAKVLGHRAWLEGEREVEAAQRILLKADSVLQYSCFVGQATAAGLAANMMFSDNVTSTTLFKGLPLSPFGPNPPPLGSFNGSELEAYLRLIAMGPPAGTGPGGNYLALNFGHKFAGGFYSTGGPCAAMAQVWRFVKCSDFNMDWFKTFEELAAADPRTQPWACNSAARNQAWADAMAGAFPVPSTPAASGGMDRTIHNNQKMFGANCSQSKPIPTGISVKRNGSDLKDHVCPSPGCYYDPSSSTCKP